MLIDTNIIIEFGKKQEKSAECRDLFDAIVQGVIKEKTYITQFALHAIEAMLSEINPNLVKKILLAAHQGQIKIFKNSIEDDLSTLSNKDKFGLNFDDATQFFAANKLGTYIVTYDKRFQKTGVTIKTPKEILKEVLIS